MMNVVKNMKLKTKQEEPSEVIIEKPSKTEVEKALKQVEVTTEKKDKRGHKIGGRGRPKKKKKPEYNKEEYSNNPMVKILNTAIVSTANKTLLRNHEKMTTEDTEIGEAVIYVLDYYSADILDHPIFVVISALLGFGAVIIDKRGKTQITELKGNKNVSSK